MGRGHHAPEYASFYGSLSTAVRCFHPFCDFCKRASIGRNGFRNSLVTDKLSSAAADDEFGLAEYFEMVRNSRGSDATHRGDITAIHTFGCRDSRKDP